MCLPFPRPRQPGTNHVKCKASKQRKSWPSRPRRADRWRCCGRVASGSSGCLCFFLVVFVFVFCFWRVQKPHSLSKSHVIKINLLKHISTKGLVVYISEMLIQSQLPVPSSFRGVLLSVRQACCLMTRNPPCPLLRVSHELSKAFALVWDAQCRCRSVCGTHALGLRLPRKSTKTGFCFLFLLPLFSFLK